MRRYAFMILATLAIVIVYLSTIDYQRRLTRDELRVAQLHYLMQELDSIKTMQSKLVLTPVKTDSVSNRIIYLQGWRDSIYKMTDTLTKTMDNGQVKGRFH